MKTTFIVEKTNTGYSAYSENGNVATVGDTYKELKENMLEALNLFLEEENKPLATAKDIVIKFDLAQFLEYYNGINIVALSEKIGVNNSLISQYKTGKKYPSEKQAQRIFKGIKSYGTELASIDLV
ncbi:helix-turn-helix transcriptional regulator [Riemerella anatipestifer]|nr:helix-turn-helix transcriptional regulator [Riemerella anatipestifer]MDY3532665.1 helix-turn-helix transcriptional regulator [Riemerella anatipestifer]MDY3534781.1 helix-turn-helix transcriptional regulator [Riemerella anatipestifer]